MRACEQCGLSIGDTATFCSVCGARFDTRADISLPDPASGAGGDGQGADSRNVDDTHGDSSGREDAPPLRPREEASLQMREAGRQEKTDPSKAATLYREAILSLLDSAADPLDRQDVRRDLLFIFDRLSLVLKRSGHSDDALEEIDSAASLGLLDCQDPGIKKHREALGKRRDSLRRSAAKRSLDAVT